MARRSKINKRRNRGGGGDNKTAEIASAASSGGNSNSTERDDPAAADGDDNKSASELYVSWEDEDFLALGTSAVAQDNDDADSSEGERKPKPKGSSSLSLDTTRHREIDNANHQRAGMVEFNFPPWLDRPHYYRQMHPLVALHNEIVSFCRLMEPMPSEMRQREDLIEQIKGIVRRTFGDRAEVKVFGSFATGLLLPTSDIDLVINGSDPEQGQEFNDKMSTTARRGAGGDGNEEGEASDKEEDWDKNAGSPLHRFADALRSEWMSELSYLEVIENTRIPLVKFTVTHLSTNISVDVSFDQPTGPPAATLVKTYMDAMPPLRPLTFVLKYFLAARGLNEPYSGGVGSFMLQLLIVSFLQHRERYSYNNKRQSLYNLGSLLLDFLCMFGLDFNYATTGISVRNDGSFFPKGGADRRATFWNEQRPLLMALENPLDASQDVAKSSFRISMVQRAFAVAYKTLMSHVSIPYEPTPSILGSILPVNGEMLERQVLKRRDRPLAAKRGNESPQRSISNKRSRWR